MLKAKISEIFSSIQGEGIYLGEKQVFVRFAGCNLKCAYCDTRHDKYEEYTADGLLNQIRSFGKDFHSVSFTGGEPLLQKDFLKVLLPLIRKEGYSIYLETNSTLPDALKELIADIDIIAMDIKLPSSTGISLDYWKSHHEFLRFASQKDIFVKAVVCSSTRLEDVLTMLQLLKSLKYTGVVVLQPNSFEGRNSLGHKLEIFKKTCEGQGVAACVIPQMHKVIGVR